MEDSAVWTLAGLEAGPKVNAWGGYGAMGGVTGDRWWWMELMAGRRGLPQSPKPAEQKVYLAAAVAARGYGRSM